jgi:hypothetical protein
MMRKLTPKQLTKLFEDTLKRLIEFYTDFDLTFDILNVYIKRFEVDKRFNVLEYLARRITESVEVYKRLTFVIAERENDDDVEPNISEYTGFYDEDENVTAEKMYPNIIVLEVYHRDLANFPKLCETVNILFLRLIFETVVTEYGLEDVAEQGFKCTKLKKPLKGTEGYRKNDYKLEIPLTGQISTEE